MADIASNDMNAPLEALSALNGHRRSIGDFVIEEINDRALVSLAFGDHARARVSSALEKTFGAAIPNVGQSLPVTHGGRLLGLQSDQIWCAQPRSATGMDRVITSWFGSTEGLYATDQSDGWTTLAVSGSSLTSVLERLCPLDLHLESFPVDGVLRTVIEHMGVIMLRSSATSCELITPRSSVHSLVHAIETAAQHINNEQALRSGDFPERDNQTASQQ